MTKPAVKITAILAALILLAGAVFHMSAMAGVKASLAGVEPAFFKSALAGMWVMPAMHWVFIAFMSIGLARYRSRSCAAILMGFGLWVLVDGLLTFMHVGPFMGVYMLALAGLLLLASGFMLRKDMLSEAK